MTTWFELDGVHFAVSGRKLPDGSFQIESVAQHGPLGNLRDLLREDFLPRLSAAAAESAQSDIPFAYDVPTISAGGAT